MKIHVTEGKSFGLPRPKFLGASVRVFVNEDYHYGVFVDEHSLIEMLTDEQQQAYMTTDGDITLDVPVHTAQRILDIGISPYEKQKLF